MTNNALQDFAGKSVLVTGASRGIGRTIAKMLAARGATISAMGRSSEDLDSLRAEIGGTSLPVDLEDLAATRLAAEAAMPVDYLVNCAGMTILEPCLDVSIETFNRVLTINTLAPVILAQAYARDRIKRGVPGAIVNVSSDAAFMGIQDHLAYCASKAALDAVTRVLAVELGTNGIRVNSVNPHVTMTDMGRMAWSAPEKANPRLNRLPLGRFLETDEVAESVIFMLTHGARMVTGQSLRVDGGYSVMG
ncbi:SDR family oxidoreductase [Pararobbsia alpina]|uniref:NAD-dependent glycerol dehydrogenase n=1 Tax=Pararobbsia alpina TaxID=621374 RepID=A0A6S7B4D1_9BURK|nr:SDR family oxidoreductase [Pararobbsia alpina]CAB3787679.1 NAD-dependent glycerol dehydrogenase [Pararobbsia alpina]